MKYLILNAFICSALCIFMWRIFQQGMLLFFIRQVLDSVTRSPIGGFIRKPLYECLTCMTSVWGFTFYYFTFGDQPFDVSHLVKFIAIVGATNAVFDAYFAFKELFQIIDHIEPSITGEHQAFSGKSGAEH